MSSQASKHAGKLICVDDDAAILEQYREIFEELGYEVLTGSNGFDLGCLISEPRITALIVDLSMPGLNGLTALKRLQIGHKHLLSKTLVVSGIIDTVVRDELEKLGVNFFKKPVDFALLVESVQAQRNK